MNYTEVKYMPERSRVYVGSPALVRMPDGTIVACHDYFYDEPAGHQGELPRLTSVYRSEDDGRTWQNVTQIIGAFWSTQLTVSARLRSLLRFDRDSPQRRRRFYLEFAG